MSTTTTTAATATATTIWKRDGSGSGEKRKRFRKNCVDRFGVSNFGSAHFGVASGVSPVASQKVNHLNNGNPPLSGFFWSHHHARLPVVGHGDVL